MKIHYLIGDATDPNIKPSLICHIVNDLGIWGRGFVMSLSSRYPISRSEYMNWIKTACLGDVQFVRISEDTHVANMVAQKGIRYVGSCPPIRYTALEVCLKRVYQHAEEFGMLVVMPRIGCVLAGGIWTEIEPIVKRTMTVDTYVYTLHGQKHRWESDYEN